MTAKVIQIRDFQNKRDMERMYSDFANQVATEISNVAIIPHDRELYMMVEPGGCAPPVYVSQLDTAPSEYCAPDHDGA